MDPALINLKDVFPIENGGDIPASYVTLPEGNIAPPPPKMGKVS